MRGISGLSQSCLLAGQALRAAPPPALLQLQKLLHACHAGCLTASTRPCCRRTCCRHRVRLVDAPCAWRCRLQCLPAASVGRGLEATTWPCDSRIVALDHAPQPHSRVMARSSSRCLLPINWWCPHQTLIRLQLRWDTQRHCCLVPTAAAARRSRLPACCAPQLGP